ncbi:MAG: shikimate kinase [Candidatus Omnitrophota bacterium]
MNRNIALVGFMGSGKTTVAKKLAKVLKRQPVSTDERIEAKEKRQIVDIFRDSGEAYFRKVEKEIIQKIALQNGLVIDCGGGVVLDQDNMDCLKNNGLIVFLSATPETIIERVKHQKHRPLLNVDDPKAKIIELLEKRKAGYAKADHTVATDNKSIQQIVDEIIEIVSK